MLEAVAIVHLVAIIFLVVFCSVMNRRHRKWQAAWDAQPTLYSLDDLRRWHAEDTELREAGCLDPDQPTPWSHALSMVEYRGTFKDRTLIWTVYREAANGT